MRGDSNSIKIGARTNIQDGTVLHCDPGKPLHIGQGVTVGHNVMLHGCTIGDGTLIGMGAVVLDGAEVGEQCIIGARALVTQRTKIPPGSMVLAPERSSNFCRGPATPSTSNCRP